ncbi:MAG: hypothetical protein K6A82_01480 [Prevotella sp.]|nr:hypothetical protein [Prevotella sp.]
MEKRCKCFPVMLLALLACLSVACTHPHARALMDRAQAEMRDNPAGALRRIDSVTADREQLSHSERMRYEVLLAVARYKNFIPATSDSVMLEVIRYYRNHGTPNEKLLAFYAAGAVCIDTDKPSLALGFFHDAVSAADTTQADCDHYTLSRVYGQMAELYGSQEAAEDEILYSRLAIRYAYKAKDTLAAIANYDAMATAYYDLGQYDKAISICKQSSDFYLSKGDTAQAALAFDVAAHILLQRGKFRQVESYVNWMDRFVIRKNDAADYHVRGIFNYMKGRYYLQVGKTDSAEYCFRHELATRFDDNNQQAGYRGLLKLYSKMRIPDSIAKYAELAINAVDSFHAHKSTAQLQRLQAVYDYSRHVRVAEEKAQEVARLVSAVIILVLLLFVITLFVVHRRQIVRQRLIDLNRNYATLILRLRGKEAELRLLQQQDAEHHAEIIDSLQGQIRALQQELAAQLQEQKHLEEWQRDDRMFNASVVDRLHELASKAQPANDEVWENLIHHCSAADADFMAFLQSHVCQLNDRERYVCILTRLHFLPSEISTLLNVSSQTVTNTRARLLQKLFDKRGGAKQFDSEVRHGDFSSQ